MRNRCFGSLTATVVVIVSLAPVPAAGQAPTGAARTWTPPRTPDGQPDVQGFWASRGARMATYSLEGGGDPGHLLITGLGTDRESVVVDPPDGKVPYQPWAAATWFDIVGTFHSDALHVVERWTFVDADTISYETTIEDPKVFTRPWKMAFPWVRNKEEGYELL